MIILHAVYLFANEIRQNVSEYDQEITQSLTADQSTAP